MTNALLFLSMACGGLIAASLVIEDKWTRRLVAGGLALSMCVATVALPGSKVGTQDPSQWPGLVVLTIVIVGLAAVLSDVLQEMLKIKEGRLSYMFAAFGLGARRALMPQLWPAAGGAMQPPTADLKGRWLIAIVAGIGGIVGSLIGQLLFDSRPIGDRLLLTLLVSGVTPALVSYYWVAALQLRARSIRNSATWPSVVAGALLYVPLLAALIGILMSRFVVDGHPPDGRVFGGAILLYVFAGIPFAIGCALLVGTAFFGLPAIAGGYAIDRMRGGSTVILALFVAIMVATAVMQLVVVGLMAIFNVEMSWFDYVNLFPGSLGWFAGLLLSGFPALINKPTARLAGAAIS